MTPSSGGIHENMVRVLKDMTCIDLRRFCGRSDSVLSGGAPVATDGRGDSSLSFLPLAANGWGFQILRCVPRV